MKNWSALKESDTLLIPLKESDEFPEIIKEQLGCTIDVDRKKGAVTIVYTLNKMPMDKIIFLGLGDGKNYRASFALIGEKCKDEKKVCVYVDKTTAFKAGLGLTYGMYSYMEERNTQFVSSGFEEEFEKGKQLALSINMARRLADMPPNILYSDVFKDEILKVAQKENVTADVYSNKELKELKANGILAVNAGSCHPAYIVKLKYNGNGDAPYIGIIGKGLTFDAGGYNIKKNMCTMKYDMCGAGNMLAVFDYVSKMKMKVNLVYVAGITDNMLNSESYIPDDIIEMMNGKTVEINNTDAEGRLVLADALMIAQKENISHLMDMATLTGACFRALGDRYTGIFTNNQPFCDEMKKASDQTEELVWQLPLDEEFHTIIRNSTKVADMNNAQPGAAAGASLAAAFIEEFVDESIPWIHIDIAGTEMFGQSAGGIMIQTVAKCIENIAKMS